jgi:hypothetical protein
VKDNATFRLLLHIGFGKDVAVNELVQPSLEFMQRMSDNLLLHRSNLCGLCGKPCPGDVNDCEHYHECLEDEYNSDSGSEHDEDCDGDCDRDIDSWEQLCDCPNVYDWNCCHESGESSEESSEE